MGCGCKKRNNQEQTATVQVSEVRTPAPTSIPAAPQQ
jgi:hypothetical protein